MQIVEEKNQRMLRPRKHAEQPPNHQLKAPLRFLRRQLRDRRLLADDELQLRDQVDHQAAVRPQRLLQRRAPAADGGVALAQDLADQDLHGLRQGGVGNIGSRLIELAGGEQPAARRQRLVQLVHHGGLADAGIAGHQHQLERARSDHALERRQQSVDLALAPIQLLGNAQAVGEIQRGERERRDTAARLPLRQAAPQVGGQAGGGLVALLGGLGEQLHHHGRERSRHAGRALGGRRRRSGDVAVHPLHRLARAERQAAGEHAVERHPHRIEVAARIDRAVHSAGLLGRHVGQRAGDHLGRVGGRLFARQARGQAETGQPHGPAVGIDQDMGRLDVLVDEPAAVQPGDGFGETQRDAQAYPQPQLRRPLQQRLQQVAARVLPDQDGLAAVAPKRQRPRRPGDVQFVLQGKFMSKAIEGRRRRMLGGGEQGQHLAAFAIDVQPRPAEEELTVLPHDLVPLPQRRSEPTDPQTAFHRQAHAYRADCPRPRLCCHIAIINAA